MPGFILLFVGLALAVFASRITGMRWWSGWFFLD
jgi:hypothetical protein